MTTTALRNAATSFVGVAVRPQTYRNLLYLLLSFPLGTAYFVALTVGFSLGIGLAITWFGIPILLATLAGATVLATVEARLTNRLLGTSIPSRSPDTSGGITTAVKRLVTDARTWVDVGYLLGRFVFGVAAFVALVALLSLSLSLLAAPLTYSTAFYVDVQVGTLTVGPFENGRMAVDTFREALGAAAVGAVTTLVSLHLLNGLARLAAEVTEAVFGTTDD